MDQTSCATYQLPLTYVLRLAAFVSLGFGMRLLLIAFDIFTAARRYASVTYSAVVSVCPSVHRKFA